MGFLDRIKTGIRLTIRSICVVRSHRALLMFPVLILAVFAVLSPFGIAGFLGVLAAGDATGILHDDNVSIALAAHGFVIYLIGTFISTFFSTALVHASHMVFCGENPDL
jgi:hypothetical protein